MKSRLHYREEEEDDGREKKGEGMGTGVLQGSAGPFLGSRKGCTFLG